MEPTETTATAPPKAIPVMDIQPPATSAPQVPMSVEPAAETTAPAVESPEVVSEPVEESSSDTPVAETTEQTSQDPAKLLAVTPDNAGKARRKAPAGAIAVAIVIALILAGATIFAYLRTSKNDTAATHNSAKSTATTPAKQEPIQAADVDTTNQGIDDSLKAIDENKDFASTDLSDTTLGL